MSVTKSTDMNDSCQFYSHNFKSNTAGHNVKAYFAELLIS